MKREAQIAIQIDMRYHILKGEGGAKASKGRSQSPLVAPQREIPARACIINERDAAPKGVGGG